MSNSHINSLLPVKNRVLGVDEDTAFLAHYDINEHDVLRGHKAEGSSSTLSFDGNNYINFGNPEHLQIVGDLTVELWVKPYDFSTRQNPIAKAYGGEFTITQEINATVSVYYGSSGSNGGSYHGVVSNSKLNKNQWNHIAMVRNLTSGFMAVYINGVLDNKLPVSHIPKAGNEPIWIGRGYVSRYKGEIKDVRIWAKAKKDDEIANEMHHGLISEEGLRARWLLMEGKGNFIEDSSSYNQDGELFSTVSPWIEGNSVFTLDKQGGKFGGAITIEEATTNSFNVPALISKKTGIYYGVESIVVPLMGEKDALGGTTPVLRWGSGGSNQFRYGNINGVENGTLEYGKTYTFSLYVRKAQMSGIVANHVQIDICDKNLKGISLTDEWQRVTTTSTLSGNNQYRFVDVSPTPSGTPFEFCCPQIEEKPFETSHTITSRGQGILSYNLKQMGIEPDGDWTISGWFKKRAGSSGWSTLFSIGDYYKENQSDFSLWANHNDQMKCYVPDNRIGAYSDSYTPPSGGINDWFYAAVSHSKEREEFVMYLFVGNDSFKSAFKRTLSSPMKPIIRIGGSTETNHIFNGWIDELRIDTKVRTEEEIVAWKESNSPFWPRGIYRES